MANHQDETRAAYDGVVELYASLFADRLETQPFARAMIGTFAELVRATGNLRAADVGCGPGHLTAMLNELGLDAFGLDLSHGMVDHARRAHPALRFQEARMESLPIEDGVLGGLEAISFGESAVADKGAGDAGEGKKMLGLPFVAAVQPSAAGEPGHGPFDDPSVSTEPL